MPVSLRIKLNKPRSQIIKDTGINDKTAVFAVREARDMMSEFIPMNTGALCYNTRIFAENGRGVILYVQPYARFCYYGEKKRFNRDKHEKASAYWDKAMILSRRGFLTARVSDFIKNNGR